MCTYNICPFNKWVLITIKQVFHKLFNKLFMFQCNEPVEMNKFLCSLACTWMTIIDSQFYIIDSLSLDVSLEWNDNLVVVWLYVENISLITRCRCIGRSVSLFVSLSWCANSGRRLTLISLYPYSTHATNRANRHELIFYWFGGGGGGGWGFVRFH